MRRGTNLPRLGDFNQAVVLDAIRRRPGGVSRVELGTLTGLTPQTISNITRRLVEEGLVAQGPRDEPSRGKPRTPLLVVPTARLAVGVHIEATTTSAVVVGLAGEIAGVHHAPTPPQRDGAGTVEVVCELVERCLAQIAAAGIDDEAVLGVGVAAPGPIDLASGQLLVPPQLGDWSDVPLRAELHRRTGRPVLLDKDVTAAVTAEHWLPTAPAGDFLYVYIGTGFAAGAVLGGQVWRGATNNAGEIVVRFDDATAQPVRLDPIGLPQRLVERAQSKGLLPPAADATAGLFDAYARLCALADESAAGRGENADSAANARRLIEESADPLAEAIATLGNFLDVDSVVLGGPAWPPIASRYLAVLPDLIAERLNARAGMRVLSSALADHGAAFGAAALVLDHFLAPHPAGLLVE